MDISNLNRPDELALEHMSVCDRVLELLDRIADGEVPTLVEMEEIAADVALLRTHLRPPCAYDFVARVPKILN